MAPDDIEKFLHNFDRGRRDFLRKILAGAAFAPPLMASFSLDGPAITAAEAGVSNQCVGNQTPTTQCFNFSDGEYQANFRGILRAADLNPGTDLAGGGHPSLNFTGGAGPAGSTWLTVLDDEPPIFEDCQLSLHADVLFHKYNNTKGAGLLALFNEKPGKKGLALLVYDAGNSDVLQLCTVDQAGNVVALKTISLGAGIGENAWYRLTMEVTDPSVNVNVTGTVSRHMVPTNPDSPVTTQIGGTLSFSGPLPSGVDPSGEVGLVARAISALVDLSVTNFCVTGFELSEPC